MGEQPCRQKNPTRKGKQKRKGKEEKLKRKRKKREERERCARSMVLRSIMAGLAIGCLGIILYAWQAPTTPVFFSIIGVAFLVAIAAFFSGGLLGFSSLEFPELRASHLRLRHNLSPRPSTLNPPAVSQATPAQATPSPAPPLSGPTMVGQPRYEDNTNLEQISDWLCKILSWAPA